MFIACWQVYKIQVCLFVFQVVFNVLQVLEPDLCKGCPLGSGWD